MRSRFVLLILFVAVSCVWGQKKPLDATVYDGWKTVRNVALSNDGKWVVYVTAPQEGDPVAEVKATDGSKTYTIERGANLQFSEDSKFLVAAVLPKAEETKKARRAKAKPEDMPKNGLAILNLENGQRADFDKIASYSMAPHDAGWILYKPEPAKAAPKAPGEPVKPDATKGEAPKQEEKKVGPKADHKPGDLYMLRNLASGKEDKLENVTTAKWSKDGNTLAYAISTLDGAGDGVDILNLKSGSTKQIVRGLGKYPKLALCDTTKDVAFATDKDDYQSKKPVLSLYVYRADGKLSKINLSSLPRNYVAAETGSFAFSQKGGRLTFATTPKAIEEKKDDTPDDEKVSVDIWNWQDPQMMPQQLLQTAIERARTFDAVYDVGTGNVVQLENPSLRTVILSNKGDGDSALGRNDMPYQKEDSWDESRVDYCAVDLQTGKATSLLTGFHGNISLSPTGKYAVGYDEVAKDFLAIDMRSGKRTSLNKFISVPIYDEEVDTPSLAPSFGLAGWTAKDNSVLVYDKFDIWQVDPTGEAKPINLTGGTGRANNIRFRLVRLDPDADYVDLAKPQILAAFNFGTKASGLYKLAGSRLQRLVMTDKTFQPPIKARGAEVYAYQRMDFNEAPDVWIAGADLSDPKKFSDANPQQKDFNWCVAELVNWISNDGQPLQGILYKPENFDASKKYPMITYFYDRSSDTLHTYHAPAPSASTINISMYCSQGYVVFVPDIPYKIGYPGESAISAIMPGVHSILARGYIDQKHLGIQGQSWGGYQVGYMVTETNMFAAACAGAPVSDMISAYGGIRWGSGVTREGQYEHGQSRIGGSLWEDPLRFIENSPIFFADKIKTPLLIMSNDKDGAVPWYQGIEYFSALRRLNKPAWLVVYNEEDHNLVQRKNRKDWSIRMQQFFDHYLKGAPMPVWMAQGVPATMKGKTMGFDLVPGSEKKGG